LAAALAARGGSAVVLACCGPASGANPTLFFAVGCSLRDDVPSGVVLVAAGGGAEAALGGCCCAGAALPTGAWSDVDAGVEAVGTLDAAVNALLGFKNDVGSGPDAASGGCVDAAPLAGSGPGPNALLNGPAEAAGGVLVVAVAARGGSDGVLGCGAGALPPSANVVPNDLNPAPAAALLNAVLEAVLRG
jgi:hypothetical protein